MASHALIVVPAGVELSEHIVILIEAADGEDELLRRGVVDTDVAECNEVTVFCRGCGGGQRRQAEQGEREGSHDTDQRFGFSGTIRNGGKQRYKRKRESSVR